jgi:hypothetical protein
VKRLLQLAKDNPQVALLAVISLVLGVGMFLAVIIALIGAGSTQTNGEPNDAILLGHLAAGLLRAAGLG